MPTSARRPKSTGRELFNSAWLETKLESLDEPVAPVDVQATLAQLTVQSLVKHFMSTATRKRFMFAVEAHTTGR